MRWILGIDSREFSRGATRFAVWLRGQAGDHECEIRGLHVIEHDDMMFLLRRRHLGEVLERAKAAVLAAVEASGVDPDTMPAPEVSPGMTAERSLEESAKIHGASGIIVGRQGGAAGDSIVRLGRVARRLVRTLPVPVIVVPPDLVAADLGPGPIVCAMTPAPESLAAARAAADLAGQLGRDVVLIHAHRPPESLVHGAAADAPELERLRQESEAKLTTFCEAHGLGELPREVLVGHAEDALLRRSEALGAPLLVCGSRRLTLGQRLFDSSLGTHFACHSRLPVMIVPPR
jgi:nucleotide-binding universal stress UspA family protein